MSPKAADSALIHGMAIASEELPRLEPIERDQLIISTTTVDGVGVVTSRYGEDQWWLDGVPSNKAEGVRRINFKSLPVQFKPVMKEIIFRYIRRGRAGLPRPKGGSVKNLFERAKRLITYFDSLGITQLSHLSPLVISSYVADTRTHKTWKGKNLSPGSLFQVFVAVEAVYELSQYTSDPMPFHPWPETSASAMTGFIGSGSRHRTGGTTPLIPDDVFCRVFDKAHQIMNDGSKLLDIRDAMLAGDEEKNLHYWTRNKAKNRRLAVAGWEHTQAVLKRQLLDLRTSCYIVIASTSGCRNHELANLLSGAHHRTEDEDGKIYHWMRAKSEKTQAGIIDWMIPSVAVKALRIMERWAEPYQAAISAEIHERRKNDPLDPQITEAKKHRHALFLGVTQRKDNQVRTLSLRSWATEISKFAEAAGLEWKLTSHQFRRKFANYAAHSKFGDLRYLREHFAHWSMDMTIGYAMDENWGAHLDLDLYTEIEAELTDTRSQTVEAWLDSDQLSGGYGLSLKRWQRDPQNLTMFKSRESMIASIAESTSIRSNGHAWCTADNDGCVGNTLERSRCGGCNQAVISDEQAPIYVNLYNNLEELMDCKDIGDAGLARVTRDLSRCREVLSQLNHDLETELE